MIELIIILLETMRGRIQFRVLMQYFVSYKWWALNKTFSVEPANNGILWVREKKKFRSLYLFHCSQANQLGPFLDLPPILTGSTVLFMWLPYFRRNNPMHYYLNAYKSDNVNQQLFEQLCTIRWLHNLHKCAFILPKFPFRNVLSLLRFLLPWQIHRVITKAFGLTC